MTTQLPPISGRGLNGCALFLFEAGTGREPDPGLLLHGLPQGRIRSAVLKHDDDGRPYFEVVLRDQHDGQDRNPRLMDVEAFLLLRLLGIGKTHVRVDRNVKTEAGERHYVTVFDDIVFTRTVAGAGHGQAAEYLGDHHDLRRSNLRIVKAAASIRQDREVVIGRATKALTGTNATRRKEAEAAGREYREMVSAERLRWLLEQAFAMLDRVPLGEVRA